MPTSYRRQLEEAQEALALVVRGGIESHSTLAGTFKNWTPDQLRSHIDWLESKVSMEADGPGRRFSAVARAERVL
jgi:hypothetical protein